MRCVAISSLALCPSVWSSAAARTRSIGIAAKAKFTLSGLFDSGGFEERKLVRRSSGRCRLDLFRKEPDRTWARRHSKIVLLQGRWREGDRADRAGDARREHDRVGNASAHPEGGGASARRRAGREDR